MPSESGQIDLLDEEDAREGRWEDLSPEMLLKLFEILYWCRTNPCGATFLLLGVLLRAPHQSIALELMWEVPNVILKLSRGMSKTFLQGLFAVLKTLLWSGATGVTLGAGARTGLIVLEDAMEPIIDGTLEAQEPREFARRSLKNPSKIINRERHRTSIKFGSRHTSSTTTGPLGKKGPSSPLRGLRANSFVQGDEMALMEEEVWAPVVKPFRNVPRGFGKERSLKNFRMHMILSGTVMYEWQMYTQILEEHETRMASGSPDHIVIEFNYEDGFYYVGNDPDAGEVAYVYVINKDAIEGDRYSGDFNLASWMAENKNVVISLAGVEFSSRLIEKCRNFEMEAEEWKDHWLVPELSCKDPCLVGIDPARERDEFAATVLRLGEEAFIGPKYPFNHIIYSKVLQQRPFQEMADEIWDIDNRFNVWFFMMDKGGGGSAIRDLLTYPDPNSGRTPIYDPNDFDDEDDEDGDNPLPQELRERGKPTLRLVDCNSERLTTWNNFIKAQMEQGKFYFVKHEQKDPNPEMHDAYRTIYLQGRQFTFIKSKAAGLWKTYFVPNRKLKKDLYSATIMVISKVYQMLQDAKRETETEVETYYEVVHTR